MFRLLIIILLFYGSTFAQTPEESYWGVKRLIFGDTFWSTDSLKLKISGMTDTLDTDTLFTDALPIKESDGLLGITAYFDSLSGTADTMWIDLRLGVKSIPQKVQKDNFGNTYTPRSKKVRWRPTWNNLIGPMKKDSLYTISISQSDSSWWDPAANILQWRLRESQGDTTLHDINEFRDVK